jgi:cystathionine beta-lyase
MHDFDSVLSRQGTDAEKYTARFRLFGREDVMPFWVADMEFAAAPVIRDALAARVSHPVYGYTSVSPSLLAAVTEWNRKRYGLVFGVDDLSMVPGVMPGVAAAMQAFTEPGDGVVVQPPLYPPLAQSVRNNGRLLLENPLVLRDGRYRINFEKLESLFQARRPKMLLFCSPHNPVGRVWEREEVAGMVALTHRYGVFLVSDEIHADIVFPPHRHISALACCGHAEHRIIVLNSASKSFNVAGLSTAYAVIPDPGVRGDFRRQLRRMNLHGANIFGMSALMAAYRDGEQWLNSLLAYLRDNRDYMYARLENELPGLEHFRPEGTYLYWLNFNPLCLSPGKIRERLVEAAGVGLNDGVTFSREHEGYWRFNFAAPRSMLAEGLDRIVRAFSREACPGKGSSCGRGDG